MRLFSQTQALSKRFFSTISVAILSTALTLLSTLAFAATDTAAPSPAQKPALETATFAGGCFWCMETPFFERPGIVSVASGYTGGSLKNPSYEEVSDGGTGHAESVQVIFDPAKISYARLLEIFWANIDPTVADQQFCDHGNQYRSAIFTHSPEQAALANASKAKWQKSPQFQGQTIYTEITPATEFYPAEDYHQHYAQKNPTRYKFYRWNCGRDQRLDEIWGANRESTH
jgi:peptide-methionine (S)-S-oxide reductase